MFLLKHSLSCVFQTVLVSVMVFLYLADAPLDIGHLPKDRNANFIDISQAWLLSKWSTARGLSKLQLWTRL